MRMARPVRLIQMNSMPSDFGGLQKLIQAHGELGFCHISQQTSLNQDLYKAKEICIFLQEAPVEPADLIVLAISIVISVLGSAQFITHTDHGRTDRKKCDQKEVSDLFF